MIFGKMDEVVNKYMLPVMIAHGGTEARFWWLKFIKVKEKIQVIKANRKNQ
jgi:hypothetical protein